MTIASITDKDAVAVTETGAPEAKEPTVSTEESKELSNDKETNEPEEGANKRDPEGDLAAPPPKKSSPNKDEDKAAESGAEGTKSDDAAATAEAKTDAIVDDKPSSAEQATANDMTVAITKALPEDGKPNEDAVSA